MAIVWSRNGGRAGTAISEMIHEERDVIDFVSDGDDVPQVAAAWKGKGKARDLGAGSNSQQRKSALRDSLPSKRARNSFSIEGKLVPLSWYRKTHGGALISEMIHEEGDVIDLVSDGDDVRQVAAARKGKGKARDLGDIIILSD